MRQELNNTLGDEVNINEFIVLKTLYSSSEPLKASSISKELKVSASHITTVTDSLVKKGFISRIRSEKDRRIVEMALTGAGELLVKALEEKKSDYLRSKFNSFSEQELDHFIRLFRKLNDD
ncbi:MarR family transcriptional regulator [Bacillus sp. V3-13]|nr:MarR family transcriptional regulator [Bacillus sp. V3-13]